MNQIKMSFLLSTAFLLVNGMSNAQELKLRISSFNVEEGIGIQGYDPVSYFIDDEPQEGKKAIKTMYKGIEYRFTSEANKKSFLQNPDQYEPQYGGWCAYAMGKDGSRVKVDPETYKIIDGNLYLFYNFYFTNTLLSWNKNEMELKEQADSNWKIQIEKDLNTIKKQMP
jgi:YHS domain-containing protein